MDSSNETSQFGVGGSCDMKNSTQYILALIGSWLNTVLIIFFFFTTSLTAGDAVLTFFILIISVIGITLNFKTAKGIKNGSQGWAVFALIMGILSIWTVYGILWLIAAILMFADQKNIEQRRREELQRQPVQQSNSDNSPVNKASVKQDYFEKLYEEGILTKEESKILRSSYNHL